MKIRLQLAGMTFGMLTFGMLTLAVALASAQEQKAAPKTAPPAAPPAREMPADVKAYNDALRLADPEKKIEALQKFLSDFPTSAGTATVKRMLVQTLVRAYSGQKEKLLAETDKLIASTREIDKSDLLNQVAWEMFQAGTLLDDAERLASQSLGLLDETKFIAGEKSRERNALLKLSDDEWKKRFRTSRAMVQDTLGQIYLKQGKAAEGEKLLKEAFAANPAAAGTAATLADLAQKKGDETAALDYLATAALIGRPPAGTQAKLETLYGKLNKGGQSLEAMLDDRYRKLYPTLHVPAYAPQAGRTDRAVLAEVFTGSGCPPCVAADLAFDAMLERYPRKDVVVIMYHLHIPAPDPMTNPSTQTRSKFYGVRGVPSYVLDGEMKSGGGSRDMAQGFFDRVNPTIEERLQAPAGARLALTASLSGTQAKVQANVSDIKDATDVKLQVALVEELLSYSGENGVRLHPMVVRSLGGANAEGFVIEPGKPAAIEHAFDLSAITDELKTHLDDFEAKAPGGRKFSQKKHAINANNLSIVAFVQDQATKKILQSAYMKLEP